jgi:hypothetical protein
MSWVAALYGGFVGLVFAFVVLLGASVIAANHTGESWYNKLIAASAKNQTGGISHISYGTVIGWLPLISLVFFFAAILSLVRGAIFRQTAEYAVTDQRVIGKYGLVNQQSVNVMLAAISGVSTSNTLLGRMFGYGTVEVEGPGISEQLVNIKNPRDFERAVYNSRQLAGTGANPLGARTAPPVQPGTAPMVAENYRRCARCGRELGPDARFCAGCGTPVG